jgi:integrase
MTARATTVLLVSRRAYGTGSLYVKDGMWYARWRTADGRHARKLGAVRTSSSRSGLTKRDAESKLREILLAADTVAVRAQDVTTVAELGAALLASLAAKGRKPSHIRSTGYHLTVHITPLLGDIEAHTLDETDVRRLIDRMEREGKSPKMIRNVVGTLPSVLGIAVDRRILDRNPCDAIELPAVAPATEIRFLTRAELERVLTAAPPDAPDPAVTQAERDQWPVTRLLVLTAAMTGMRLGELRALRWQALDFGAMKVRVRYSYVRGQFGTPKSRRSVRAIPLTSRLVRELDEHHRQTVWNQDADLVLAHPHTGRPLDDTKLLRHFKAALRRADVRPVRVHDLRHTFATTVAASGQVSIRTLQEWMGHQNITTTQIYADYLPGEREQQQLDAAFGEDPAAGGQSGGQSLHRDAAEIP